MLNITRVTALQENKALARKAQAGFVKKGEDCSKCRSSHVHSIHQYLVFAGMWTEMQPKPSKTA